MQIPLHIQPQMVGPAGQQAVRFLHQLPPALLQIQAFQKRPLVRFRRLNAGSAVCQERR